ncbi:MAG: class I SAM-dependent methyltransferase [Candidatus Dormibacterales bacterium]
MRRPPRWAPLALAALGLGVAVGRRRYARTGGEWYKTVYRLAYRGGFTPWDRGVPAPHLVAFLETADRPQPALALDLGCGTGTNAVCMARHGWDVTGVDMVPAALAEGRRRAYAAGLSVRFLEGDVTRLGDLKLGDGFGLLLDAGCFHTLPDQGRDPYVVGITALARQGATLFLYGFARRGLGPLRTGLTPEEVKARFVGWALEQEGRVAPEELPDETGAGAVPARLVNWFDLWHYRLRRL